MKGHYGYKKNGYFNLKYIIYPATGGKGYSPISSSNVLPKVWHENKLTSHVVENIYQPKTIGNGGIDDIFKDRLGLIRSKVDLILLQLEERKKISQEVLSRIDNDTCRAQNIIFEMGYRTYRMDRDRLSLERIKFDLESQRRMEETSYFRDTGLLNKDLKDALIQYLGEVQKSAFINEGRETT